MIVLGFIGFYPGFIGFYRALSGFIGFYRALVGFGGLWWALVGFGGFWWVLVGFSALILVDVRLGLACFRRATIPVGEWVVFLLFRGVFSGRSSADLDRSRVGGWSSRHGHEAPSRWVGGWFGALTSRDQPPTCTATYN